VADTINFLSLAVMT